MTSQHDKPKRWRPWQFSVSTLLLLTALVAVAVGWWLDRQRLKNEVRSAKAVAIERELLKAVELVRMKLLVSEVQADLLGKTKEAEVYLQTIEELAKQLKAE